MRVSDRGISLRSPFFQGSFVKLDGVARVRLVDAGAGLRSFSAWVSSSGGAWLLAARYAGRHVDAFPVTVGLPAAIERPLVDVPPNAAGVWSLCPLDWLAEDDEDSGDWLVVSPGGVPLYRLTGVGEVPPWAFGAPSGAVEQPAEVLPRAA